MRIVLLTLGALLICYALAWPLAVGIGRHLKFNAETDEERTRARMKNKTPWDISKL